MARIKLEGRYSEVEHSVAEGNITWQNAMTECVLNAVDAFDLLAEATVAHRVFERLKARFEPAELPEENAYKDRSE